MTRIVQIVPKMATGSGVAGVAFNLDRELRALGAHVERFTLREALRGKPMRVGKGWRRERFLQAWRVVWFSTVGTRRARKFLAERPDAVSICHNNVMAGDVYVNHGVLFAAMRARGHGVWRMVRNPTHVFTYVRDLIRYRSGIHRAVVALTTGEVETMRRTYGRIRPRTVVISNGVDLERFRPPTPDERAVARGNLSLEDEHRVALFIGHEFDRKGLPIAIAAMAHAPTVLLLVVGGQRTMVEQAHEIAVRHGVADRVMFVGQRADLFPYLAAADMFVFPSVYESSGLVFLEALASGLPVVATPVGVAADLVVDDVNGYLVPREPATIGDRLERIAASDPEGWRTRSRQSVLGYSWRAIAEQYLDLVHELEREHEAERSGR
ncbi:glycosyltransferase [Microbacterium thalassium]|uniref:UDP-glucose:(Heptosyl)LPS alpha-1,3-glucosyltransferase n=1 Tax=Microbacterium thalassium TaxID=362649 RepID=A0A7X0KT99_9MICO|nr:glycosyltransferase [Microbacterium thalassium]MBB6389884.1 UDP-glucose:(heptosyl)LPS alpha-1,3-glucosyltransferase [Microbacterium thalassium]GLK24571.1 glycosyl transferase [Microbacterium thalassium]